MSDAQVHEVLRECAAYEQWLRPQVSAGVAELMDVSLHDGQVQSFDGGVEDLARLVLFSEGVELLHDEFELLDGRRLVHRVLVWPDGEVRIRFRDAGVRREPTSPRARR